MPVDPMTLGGVSVCSALGLTAQMALLHVLKDYLLPGDPESSDLLVEEGASLHPQEGIHQRAMGLLSSRWAE